MNYSEMCRMYRTKFAQSNLSECNYAIKDIDATLKHYPGETTDHPYVAKLFAERDAVLDRKMKLSKTVL